MVIVNGNTYIPSADGKIYGQYPLGDAPTGSALTVNAVSQDQIDISWTAASGRGIQIERATNLAGPYSTVIFYPDDESSVKLYSHQPNTQYYFRAKFVDPLSESGYSAIVSATTLAAVNTIHVKTTGNDTTGDGSDGNPYATISKGVAEATAGDVVNVHVGTYTNEQGGTTVFGVPMGPVFQVSATEASPIILQANPGDVVTIRQTDTYGGFHLPNEESHIHIKDMVVRNARFTNLYVPDNATIDYTSMTGWCVGGVIEGCEFYDTYGDGNGKNNAALRPYACREWTFRNNLIDTVTTENGVDLGTHNEGILSYNLVDSIVEYNEITKCNVGVYHKANPLNITPSDLQTKVRYNYMYDLDIGFTCQSSERGSGGYNIVNYNVFANYERAVYGLGTNFNAKYDIEHNYCDGDGAQSSSPNHSLFNQDIVAIEAAVSGNVIHGHTAGNGAFDWRSLSQDVTSTDYNIFTADQKVTLFVNDLEAIGFTTLAAWQAATALEVQSTITVPPDINSSIVAVANTATDKAAGDYSIPNGSTLEGYMSDGSNAGPYRFGGEIIGRLP